MIVHLGNDKYQFTDFDAKVGPNGEINSTVSERYREEAVKSCGGLDADALFKRKARPEITGYGHSVAISQARNLWHVTLAKTVCHDTIATNCTACLNMDDAACHGQHGFVTEDPRTVALVVREAIDTHLFQFF